MFRHKTKSSMKQKYYPHIIMLSIRYEIDCSIQTSFDYSCVMFCCTHEIVNAPNVSKDLTAKY